jgi:type IV pilus assembly protein PilN
MPHINLLPWRETERKRKLQEFTLGVVVALGVGLVVGLGASYQMESAIDHQNERNQLLKTTIADVDKQIAEVLGLEEQQRRLEARMDVIEQLQRSRPVVVHLFDELVRIMPDGVYLTSFKQTGSKIDLQGKAQSWTRIAALLRAIDSSEWLTSPNLVTTESKNAKDDASYDFTLSATQKGLVAEPSVASGKGAQGKKPARKN